MRLHKAEEYLVNQGLVTPAQLNEAAGMINDGIYAREISVPKILFEEHRISEIQYIMSLSVEYGYEYVDIAKLSVPISLKEAVPRAIAQKYNLCPIANSSEGLVVAVNDPENYTGIEEVKKMAKKNVIVVITDTMSLEHAIADLYGKEAAMKAMDDLKADVKRDGYADSVVDEIDNEDDNASNAEKIVNSLLRDAVRAKASDIHFEPHSSNAIVRFRVDGQLRDEMVLPNKGLHTTIVARIKIMGDMSVSETRHPQDGRYSFKSGEQEVDLRINSIPTVFGEKVVMRLLNKSEGTLDKSAIGLIGDDYKKYERLISNHNGVILMAGPTGSGKSTTMYTIIKILNQKNVNVMTLEDPVEYNIDGVNQIQINEKIQMTFASGLRAAMRQDPDIIGVGEIRDGETAEIAMRSAITGHLVISTIHTNDAVSVIDRLTDMGVEPFLISNALLGVISQRLVRKICPNCRKEYQLSEEEVELMGGPAAVEGHKYYHGTGCSFCYNTGYRGRTGVFEILVMDSSIRRAITAEAPREEIMRLAIKGGMVTLKQNCINLINQGITTVEEMKRIVNSIE